MNNVTEILIGHDRFLPPIFQFIYYLHSVIRRHFISYWKG